MEEGHAENDTEGVGAGHGFVEDLVLGNEIAVRGLGAFEWAGGARGEEEGADGVTGEGLRVEGEPVGFVAVREEGAPRGTAFGAGGWLLRVVEDEEFRF